MHQKQYEKLIVWKEAHQLCLKTYRIVDMLPDSKRFGLSQQMRRAAYSVPMNIAEGNTRRTLKDKLRFLTITEGSLDELDYHALLCKDVQYITQEQCEELKSHIIKVAYLLTRLRIGISSIKTASPQTPKLP